METQRGVYPRFFAGEAITAAISADGIGKAVMYKSGEVEEVFEATEAGFADFAGIIATVDAEATITRVNSHVNQGVRNVALGDAVGLENDTMTDALIDGAVNFGDLLTTADGGKFQKLTLSATPTAEEVLKIVGRAMETLTDSGVGKVHIWVRK